MFYFSLTLFSLLKHYLDLYITDTALKVSRSLYFFTTSIFHGVENFFPRLWGRASLMLFLSSYTFLDAVCFVFALEKVVCLVIYCNTYVCLHWF